MLERYSIPDSVRGERSIALTPRQTEVLQLIARGLANGEVGKRLGISVKTVKSHLASTYDILTVGSSFQAVMKSLRLGLIDLNDIVDAESMDAFMRALTPSEEQILSVMIKEDGANSTVKDLARITFRGDKTIKHHFSTIGRKTGISGKLRMGVLYYAAKSGEIAPQRAQTPLFAEHHLRLVEPFTNGMTDKQVLDLAAQSVKE